MPRFELRTDGDAVDSLAPFKVLAVMCHPEDVVRREQQLALIQRGSGQGRPRREPLVPNRFNEEVKLAAHRAGVAGGLLLTMLQLQGNGHAATLNCAIPLVSALLPEWTKWDERNWSKESHMSHHPRSRRKMLDAFKSYRTVAHLWAAMIYGGEEGRRDIWPGSIDTLPTFLAYADCFLNMACGLPWRGRDRRFALDRSQSWVFTIPKRFIKSVSLQALPFNEEQICILNEQTSSKSLI